MELVKFSALEIAEAVRNKQIGAPEVVAATLSKIRETQVFHTCITLDEERALEKASRLQDRIQAGENPGALAGVPMIIKDNICSAGIRTTCGSRMLQDFVPTYSAHALSLLEEEGAILLGKSNMDEFAMGSTTENSYFGVTRNPFDVNRVAGGSSGGSACGVALGQCTFALGSDTGGSIRQPASFCGVVGLKPTYGRVSRYGLVSYGSSLDQIGPLARTVEDVATIFAHISRYDKRDNTCIPRQDAWVTAMQRADRKEMRRLLTANEKKYRIGILRGFGEEELCPEMERAMEEVEKFYKSLGMEAGECRIDLCAYAAKAYYLIACAEAGSNLERYDGVKYGYRPEGYKDMEELYILSRSRGFGKECKRRILFGTYVLSEGMYDKYYLKALQVRRKLQQEFQKAFESYDLLLLPVTGGVAPLLQGEEGDFLKTYEKDVYTVSANLTGMPAIALPCGKNKDGLPMGFQLMANHFEEDKLLQAAYAYERETGGAVYGQGV